MYELSCGSMNQKCNDEFSAKIGGVEHCDLYLDVLAKYVSGRLELEHWNRIMKGGYFTVWLTVTELHSITWDSVSSWKFKVIVVDIT